MLDLNEVLKTIDELEAGPTTYDTCIKLASLYTIRDHMNGYTVDASSAVDSVEEEYHDILPSYRRYCETKRKYQRKEITKEAVITDISHVTQEIYEFITTLYGSTDMPDERDEILKTLRRLVEKDIS